MRQIFTDALRKSIASNSALIVSTKVAAKAFNCEQNPLNNLALSRYVDFLIQIKLLTLEQALEINNTKELLHLIEQAFIPIVAGKRGVVFRLNELTLFANRYGVITYPLNTNFPLKGWHCEESPSCSDLIMDVMKGKGVLVDRRLNDGERIHDYTALAELIQPDKKGYVVINEDISGNYHVGSSDNGEIIDVEFFNLVREARKECRDIKKATGNTDFIIRKAKLTDNATRLVIYSSANDVNGTQVLLLNKAGDTFIRAITFDDAERDVA